MTVAADPIPVTTLVVVILAAIGGFIWFGKLSSRVDRLESGRCGLEAGAEGAAGDRTQQRERDPGAAPPAHRVPPGADPGGGAAGPGALTGISRLTMLAIDPATAATFVTVLLASAGGRFRLGKLSRRVDRLERDVQQILTRVGRLEVDMQQVLQQPAGAATAADGDGNRQFGVRGRVGSG